MPFLLYSRATRETGSYLGDLLGIPHGTEPPDEQLNLLIRWGSTAPVARRPSRVLNKSTSIARSTDKFGALNILRDAGILVPRFVRIDEVPRPSTEAFRALGFKVPLLARNSTHTRAKDVMLCLQDLDFNRAIRWGKEFFVEYIPTQREYRVHVFNGNIIRVSEKVLRNRKNYISYLRTHEHNHIFKEEREPLSQAGRDIAVRAVRALDLDFGAVDLLLGDDNNIYVLEVNTGPSLVDSGAEVYVLRMREELTRANTP